MDGCQCLLLDAEVEHSPTTIGEVAGWSRLNPDDADLARIVPAVNAFIRNSCPSAPRHLLYLSEDTGKHWHHPHHPGQVPWVIWDADTRLGALMLAARLFRRRNSPNGVEAMTDAGASYVSRYDSDIARLLRIDGFDTPKVG